MSVILEMRNITKIFGSVVANDNVSFEVEKGEVHALLGENGAGKSTLMNILYGMYPQNEGEIIFKGNTVKIENPKHAIDLGIGMVHQHFMLIPALTVIENVVLGHKDNGAILDLQKSAERFKELAEKYNMQIDPWELVGDLSVGQQQRLEIIKAIYREADLLILDEPTAVLTPQEVLGLKEIMQKLTDEGKTIIFISHKMAEIMDLCDRCTVLRLGKVMALGLPIANISNVSELANLMVGKDVPLVVDKDPPKLNEVVLSVQNLSYKDRNGVQKLTDVSFELRGGEILGICGVDGNGQSELIHCITGLVHGKDGVIKIRGNDITHLKTREVLDFDVGHIPEDRLKEGLVPNMDLRENITLMNFDKIPFARKGIINWNFVNKTTDEICEQFNVKTPNSRELAGHLSGGNQQKFVVGRELSRKPKLIIAAHPTRGLDVGATKYIQKQLISARDEGAAILMISTELYEIMEMSDRILTLCNGKVMGIIDQKDANTTLLGLLMGGCLLTPELLAEYLAQPVV